MLVEVILETGVKHVEARNKPSNRIFKEKSCGMLDEPQY